MVLLIQYFDANITKGTSAQLQAFHPINFEVYGITSKYQNTGNVTKQDSSITSTI